MTRVSPSLRLLPLLSIALVHCESGPAPEPESIKKQPVAVPKPVWREPTTKVIKQKIGGSPSATPTASAAPAEPTVAKVAVTPGDPTGGKFTLDDATKGMPPGQSLVAVIDTEKGKLECDLWPDKAPITVANFVGLARGVRPWKDGSEWVKKPLYDGTPFHRVIPGFMIQGGDPKGTGAGGPGYVIPDEIWEGAKHDEPGLLCMANRGKNTNGSQFFVMDGAAKHLDGGYTIFGKCKPLDVIKKIATVERQRDRAVNPVKIKKVTIRR